MPKVPRHYERERSNPVAKLVALTNPHPTLRVTLSPREGRFFNILGHLFI